MKSSSFVVVPAPRQRRHRALFDQDLPFRGRSERSKIAYQRRNKHPQRSDQS